MALGAASSMVLSGMGSAATRAIYPKSKTDALVAENEAEKSAEKEVVNA